MSDRQVLLADEPDELAAAVEAALEAADDLVVERATTAADAEERLREGGVDCLVAACQLPDGEGIELVEAAREAAPDVGCVLYGEEPPALGDDAEPVVEFVPSDAEDPAGRVAQLVATTVTERTQTAYPLPARERERLAALDRYDAEGEPELEDVVEHAAEHFDVPQASINVIGADEQRFAVTHGAEWDAIPRQSSICTYTILQDRPLVVEDVASDPRFEDNEILAELGIRSYAGAPIDPDDSPPIATLCVYSERPGAFGAEEAAYLQTLARDAAAVIARGGADERDAERDERGSDGGER